MRILIGKRESLGIVWPRNRCYLFFSFFLWDPSHLACYYFVTFLSKKFIFSFFLFFIFLEWLLDFKLFVFIF